MAKKSKTVETSPVAAQNGEKRRPNGTFAVGHCGGPGRPKGYDFRAIVREFSEREGFDVDRGLWLAFGSLLKLAINGDVQATKLLIEKLGVPEMQQLQVTAAAITPTLPAGQPLAIYMREFFAAASAQGLVADAEEE